MKTSIFFILFSMTTSLLAQNRIANTAWTAGLEPMETRVVLVFTEKQALMQFPIPLGAVQVAKEYQVKDNKVIIKFIDPYKSIEENNPAAPMVFNLTDKDTLQGEQFLHDVPFKRLKPIQGKHFDDIIPVFTKEIKDEHKAEEMYTRYMTLLECYEFSGFILGSQVKSEATADQCRSLFNEKPSIL